MADRSPPCGSGTVASAARAPIIELVGPAASGKTSLHRRLAHYTGAAGTVRRVRWAQVATATISLVPTFLAAHRPYRGLLRKEMKRMAYVAALRQAIERPWFGTESGILDEGPIYMLARLKVFGGRRLESRAFERWWQATLREWAPALTLIVRLDAPDAILIDRLRTRGQAHPIRGLSDEAITSFLADYRDAYDLVVAALAEQPGAPPVLSFRSDRHSTNEIAVAVDSYLQRRIAV